jgi:SRSO17 transposase
MVFGLLADLPRKNCWTIAEHAGDRDPHGMQHLLARASWDTDGVRDDLRDYVTAALGDVDAVLGCVNQKWPRSSPLIWPHGW